MKTTTPDNPIIVAIDVQTVDEAAELAASLVGSVGAFKVGRELFTAAGPAAFQTIREVAGEDVKIFYDAKLYDIPNTVAGAVEAALKHKLWMVNVHASGGSAVMRAAVEAAAKGGEARPLIIAVTVITSIDKAVLNGEIGVAGEPVDYVVKLAKLAQASGCDGVVASPHEVIAIREACGPDFLTVIPGVRPKGADIGDQKRIMSPGEAIQAGADYLVIGRPITQAKDPRAAAKAIVAEINIARAI